MNRWQIYEIEKAKLQAQLREMKLSSAEYEQAIRKLVKELRL